MGFFQVLSVPYILNGVLYTIAYLSDIFYYPLLFISIVNSVELCIFIN